MEHQDGNWWVGISTRDQEGWTSSKTAIPVGDVPSTHPLALPLLSSSSHAGFPWVLRDTKLSLTSGPSQMLFCVPSKLLCLGSRVISAERLHSPQALVSCRCLLCLSLPNVPIITLTTFDLSDFV